MVKNGEHGLKWSKMVQNLKKNCQIWYKYSKVVKTV